MSNKIYPNIIEHQIKTALAFYSELQDVPIEFKFKKNIKKSTMQAQPRFSTILSSRHKREYLVFIKEKFVLNTVEQPISNLPNDVLVGWIGHELGHIMDYEKRSNIQLIKFGFNYLFFNSSIIEAERTADRFAVEHGMLDYILKTKEFILKKANIPQKYRNRINKYYLSTEELMEIAT